MYASTYKKIGIGIIIIGVLLGIFLAISKIQVVDSSSSYLENIKYIEETVFSWKVFLTSVVVSFITGFLFIGISDIVQTLVEIKQKS